MEIGMEDRNKNDNKDKRERECVVAIFIVIYESFFLLGSHSGDCDSQQTQLCLVITFLMGSIRALSWPFPRY